MIDPSIAASAVTSWQGLLAFLALLVWNGWNSWRSRRDTRAIRAQTENDHADAEYPNLREQLDAMHADIRTAASKADDAASKADTAAKVAADTQSALTEHVAHDEAWKVSVEDDLAQRRRPLFSWRH